MKNKKNNKITNEKTEKVLKYRLKFIDNFRYMSPFLKAFTDNLSTERNLKILNAP